MGVSVLIPIGMIKKTPRSINIPNELWDKIIDKYPPDARERSAVLTRWIREGYNREHIVATLENKRKEWITEIVAPEVIQEVERHDRLYISLLFNSKGEKKKLLQTLSSKSIEVTDRELEDILGGIILDQS